MQREQIKFTTTGRDLTRSLVWPYWHLSKHLGSIATLYQLCCSRHFFLPEKTVFPKSPPMQAFSATQSGYRYPWQWWARWWVDCGTRLWCSPWLVCRCRGSRPRRPARVRGPVGCRGHVAGVVQPVGIAVQSAVGEDMAAGFLGGDTRPVERAGDGAASRHHDAMGEGGWMEDGVHVV